MAFPEGILRKWFAEEVHQDAPKGETQKAFDNAFNEWVGADVYAGDTMGLFDFSCGLGFVPEREDWKEMMIQSVSTDSSSGTAEYHVVTDDDEYLVVANGDSLEISRRKRGSVDSLPKEIALSVLSFIDAHRSEFEDTRVAEDVKEPPIYALAFQVETDVDTPYFNAATFLLEDGREVVIDRDRTYYGYTKETAILSMTWTGVYIWDGEKENYDVPMSMFQNALLLNLELEDDAPPCTVKSVRFSVLKQ